MSQKSKKSKKAAMPMAMPKQQIRSNKQDISLCLTMIVKDEEDTIVKCIRAVAPYISYYVIVDTGSSDNTINVIKETMLELNIEGEIYERPWVNFEVNRTESLELAKGKCDYRWIIDADDVFVVKDPAINPFGGLDNKPDCYQVMYHLDNLTYYRSQLVKSDQDWVYKGVLHEYLHLEKPEILQGNIEHAYVNANISPLKRAGSLIEKYSNDAKILEEALLTEPDNTRYMYYLAQSYRDSEQMEKAIEWYQKRAEAGGWDQEVYHSLYMVGILKEKSGYPIAEVTDAYSRAWEYRPERLEAVFHTMIKLREQKRFLLSFAYGEIAIKTQGTRDILFVEPEIWQWRLLDEYSLAAYYIGNPEISYQRTSDIVKAPFFKDIADTEKQRLLNNLDFYKKQMDEKNKTIQSIKKSQKK